VTLTAIDPLEIFHLLAGDCTADSKREKQIDTVTFNIAGMYGDLQGLVPALPAIRMLELPEAQDAA